MLEDIEKITKKTIARVIQEDKDVASKHNFYDIYRSLQKVVDDIELVSEHYLALDFNEEYLQNSSWDEPSDKWRKFFNKDLEHLNSSIQKYLMNLYFLSFKKNTYVGNESFICEIFSAKMLYSVIRDEYNVGYVKPCGFDMIMTVFDLTVDSESIYIVKHKKTDLASFEKREELQRVLRERKKFFDNCLVDMKSYMISKYSLEDLL